MRALKRLVNEGTNAALETALSYEQLTLIGLYATADGQVGEPAVAVRVVQIEQRVA